VEKSFVSPYKGEKSQLENDLLDAVVNADVPEFVKLVAQGSFFI
jgi:hypothetical protein